ncbi:hypothetical protein [uncultured Draconibacterium sp.]|uniref:hypothetical protein n=1 Tax=uncultured Draconibacterium sp. TaxID=1573823 RepID=UPI0025E757BD|nr:hypothetical protein [uncultured Draconibacterium sp.]
MKTIKPTDLQPGDIPAICTPKGFLPKGIRAFMWLWSVIHYRRIPKGKLYNHTMIVFFPGKIAEAVKRGYVRHLFMEHYADRLEHMVVFRPRQPLTAAEIEKLQQASLAMADRNVEYEILNFFYWMVYIVTNGRVDWFPKGSKIDDKVFCFEVSATHTNDYRPGFFARPSHTNTVDLQNDDRFEQLYFKE